MAGCVHFVRKLVRKKIYTDDDVQETDLKRCLTTVDLIGLGGFNILIYILT